MNTYVHLHMNECLYTHRHINTSKHTNWMKEGEENTQWIGKFKYLGECLKNWI